MPHAACQTRPRPRPIPEILEAAGRICLERPLDYYLVAAVTLLTSWTMNQIVRVWTIGGVPLGALEDPRAPEFLHALGHLFGAGVADGMVYALVNSVGGAVLIMLVARRGERRPSLTEGIVLAAPRFGPAILSTLLFFLSMACLIGLAGAVAGLPLVGLAGGMAAGIAGGPILLALRLLASLATLGAMVVFGLAILYVWLRWALYPQAVVLEGRGPLAALQRSAALTRDDPSVPWVDRYLVRAGALTACMVLLQAVVGAFGSAPYGIGLLLSQGGDPSRTSILNPTGMPLPMLIPSEIFSVLVRAAVFPISVAVFVVLYEDVLTHRETPMREDAPVIGKP